MITQYEITIKGLVQGVGFRPFVYTIAHELNLHGTVANNTAGVIIQLQSTEAEKDLFVQRIQREKPVISSITDIVIRQTELNDAYHRFHIADSQLSNHDITRISPDIAICDQCMDDYRHQPHRIDYPFVNCTHCGPRFSIIKSIPYDRSFTTMEAFEMCPTCQKEYQNPLDRRFHAQPVACNHCGPYYTAYYKEKETIHSIHRYTEIVDRMVETLCKGGIVAL